MEVLDPPIKEIYLQALWNEQNFCRELFTFQNELITVLYPGKWNFGPGPDFLNARLKINDLEICGDVEIHFTAKDFETHEIAAEIFMPRTVRSQEGIASQKVLQGYGSMFSCSDLVDGSVVGRKIKWLEPSSHIACIRVEDELEYNEIFSARYAVW